jgi:hypothetical protein
MIGGALLGSAAVLARNSFMAEAISSTCVSSAVSRIEELRCRVWVISPIGFRARRDKERIIFAPDG